MGKLFSFGEFGFWNSNVVIGPIWVIVAVYRKQKDVGIFFRKSCPPARCGNILQESEESAKSFIPFLIQLVQNPNLFPICFQFLTGRNYIQPTRVFEIYLVSGRFG
ncbi:MAG: hypothetical protein A2126_00425 [Candidatus Woykebacteria bacterium GWB1_45_5]|uniref:Uncharacterized protein n=1 Tax=Candidatus Woykebacteria bacterium GWB1_45_5 TaxID=1802592 RepID=A0A1G1W4M0_9BACT|nr:MAG: hypothetical protein A2126_00425 [Candidatus Woykebacteria bacterium GWB1_45_5]